MFRGDIILPFVFPNIISQVAKNYNEAHILVEVNDIGQQISEALQFEIEYPTICKLPTTVYSPLITVIYGSVSSSRIVSS